MYTDSPTEAESWGWIYKVLDNLFAHYYNDIIDHPIRQIRLSFRFANSISCVFPIKKFELHGNQFFHAEIVNLNYREIQHLKLSNKCEIFESTYDMDRIHAWLWLW